VSFGSSTTRLSSSGGIETNAEAFDFNPGLNKTGRGTWEGHAHHFAHRTSRIRRVIYVRNKFQVSLSKPERARARADKFKSERNDASASMHLVKTTESDVSRQSALRWDLRSRIILGSIGRTLRGRGIRRGSRAIRPRESQTRRISETPGCSRPLINPSFFTPNQPSPKSFVRPGGP
jgi:hypothetical protein